MKTEQTPEQKIIEATTEIAKYMVAKITLSLSETEIQVAKKKNHYLLQKSKERLVALENELLN